MCREICVKKYILGVSLICKAELKRMLVGCLVKISVKGGRCQPIRLNNKDRRHLMFNSLALNLLIKEAMVQGVLGPVFTEVVTYILCGWDALEA